LAILGLKNRFIRIRSS